MRSKILRDRPVKPIDSAVYWTEYVIKYNGAAHLRTAAMDLEWYQLYSIDIILLVIAVDIIAFLVFYYIIKRILGRKKKVQEDKKDTKKKQN